MIPFFTKFPDIADQKDRSLVILKLKGPGALPPDTYQFIELFCHEKNCDCRRVMISVFSEQKNKIMATINFPFDADNEAPGPFLDPLNQQSEYADEILDYFMKIINQDTDYVRMLQQHYVLFKEKIDQQPYHGKPFEFPASPYIATEPPVVKGEGGVLKILADRRKAEDPDKPKTDYRKPDKKAIKEVDIIKALFSGLMKDDAQINISELIQTIASRLNRSEEGNIIDNVTKRKIMENPDLAFPLLEEILDTHSPKGLNPELSPEYEACIILFQEFLTEIRYAVERNREWAIEASDAIQRQIAQEAFEVSVDTRVQSDLLQCLYRAGLSVHPLIKEKSEELAEYYSRFTASGGSSSLERMFNAMVADGFQDPYDLLDYVMAELAIISEEGQLSVIAEMCQSQHQVIRDFAGLMLLHPNPEVRQHVPLVLCQFADETAISPAAFRRMIGLRNWLPEEERQAADLIIKKARMARVECAPMPAATFESVSASTFDGSGIQGLWLFGAEKKKFHLSGLLVKQQEGVREAWVRKNLSKSEKNSMHQDIAGSIANCKVQNDYFNRLISHFLWEGVKRQQPPPPELLQVAEVTGQSYWLPSPVQYDQELAHLKTEANPKHLQDASRAKVLSESRTWPETKSFATSWFEDDASIDDMINDQMVDVFLDKRKFNKIANAMIKDLFEKKRDIWFERMLWMTLWAKSAIVKPPFPWVKFLIIADELHKGTPLKKIPLIMGVVERSIYFSFRRIQH